MTRDEAKFILQGSRPGESGPDPEALKQAMDLAAHDLELRAWYEQDQAFDQAVLEKLCQIEPPPGLQERILERMTAEHAEVRHNGVMPFKATGRGIALAAAAAVVFLIGFSLPGLLRSGPEAGSAQPVPEYLAYLSEQVINQPHALQHPNATLEDIHYFLEASGVASCTSVPGALLSMQPLGCMVLERNGAKLGVVCFVEDGAIYHLFSANITCYPAIFPDLCKTKLPARFRVGETVFLLWRESDQVNILTHEGANRELNTFF